MPAHYQRYSVSRWLFQLAGALAAIAVALLSGAVIAGVGIYIVNDALGPPAPPAGATASKASALTDSAGSRPRRLAPRPSAAATGEGGSVKMAEPGFRP